MFLSSLPPTVWGLPVTAGMAEDDPPWLCVACVSVVLLWPHGHARLVLPEGPPCMAHPGESIIFRGVSPQGREPISQVGTWNLEGQPQIGQKHGSLSPDLDGWVCSLQTSQQLGFKNPDKLTHLVPGLWSWKAISSAFESRAVLMLIHTVLFVPICFPFWRSV